MSTVPAIVAMNAARGATEHARALEVVSEPTWPRKRRWMLVVFVVAACAIAYVLARFGIIASASIGPVVGALLVVAGLCAEIFSLRRQVDALSHLVLEQERLRHAS